MQTRRFPNRTGQGLLGDAPPGYGPPPPGMPPGVPPPGIPPPGVPPPPLPGHTPGQTGFPRGPLPGLPPVISQANSNQQSQSSGGLTSPSPGAMPPYIGGALPNVPPPPQTSLTGLQSQTQNYQQQQSQQQANSNNMLHLPGSESGFATDTALALVNQLLQGGALNNITSANLNASGLGGNNAAATSMTPIDVSVPPPPVNTAQISGLHNNNSGSQGMLQQTQQQMQSNFMPQQFGANPGGTGASGTLIGSSSITSSTGLNVPGIQATGMYSNTNTNQGLLNSPSPQTAPSGSGMKSPLLAPPPGIIPNIPPPNHPHARVGLLPNPPAPTQGLYSQQASASAQQPAGGSNFTPRNGVSNFSISRAYLPRLVSVLQLFTLFYLVCLSLSSCSGTFSCLPLRTKTKLILLRNDSSVTMCNYQGVSLIKNLTGCLVVFVFVGNSGTKI